MRPLSMAWRREVLRGALTPRCCRRAGCTPPAADRNVGRTGVAPRLDQATHRHKRGMLVCLFLFDIVQPQAPVPLEHRQNPNVITGDAVDDSIGPQKELADVVPPKLWHDAAPERRRRGELRLLDETRRPALGGLPVIARDETKNVDQVVA